MPQSKNTRVPLAVRSALALAVSACLLLGGCAKAPPVQGKEVTITDSGGNVLAKANSEGKLFESEYRNYIEIVYDEALQLLIRQEGCTREEAKQLLFAKEHQIKTAFDPDAHKALSTLEIVWKDSCAIGAAITDLQGNLLAAGSVDPAGQNKNYALERRSPCSSFKALSVYTPAVERGVVHWSTLFEDSPYKQLTENGTDRDWPANATGKYSMANTPVSDAVSQSLNTVAVKCLKELGVEESIAFLQNRFGIPLEEEEYVLKAYGEEELLGSIALGYPETGITPVEMAGYYQIFGNGGIYTAPRTILSVTAGEETLYQQEAAGRQAVTPETADIMNKLLQGVVARGGTGERASCSGIEVAGKTGTGENNQDNWFVGVTPAYTLAVWHGEHSENDASEMFSAVMQALYDTKPNAPTKFVSHATLQQIAFCEESGMAYSPDCDMIKVGYYSNKEALPLCEQCGKEEGTK